MAKNRRSTKNDNAEDVASAKGCVQVNVVVCTTLGAVIVVIAANCAMVLMSSSASTLMMPATQTIKEVPWKGEVLLTAAAEVQCCQVERRHIDTMTQEAWNEVYNAKRPVILQGVMDKWPARTEWDFDFFRKGPWSSHEVQLKQHGPFQACMDTERTIERVQERHGSKGQMDPNCEALLSKVDTIYEDGMAEGGGGLDAISLALQELLGEHGRNVRRKVQIGTLMGEMLANQSDYGTYLFLESKVFQKHPELWTKYITPLHPFLDPVDFSPHDGNEGASRRNLLLGSAGSRSTLHMDPYGWTSWIAVLSGSKAFRVWPPNATKAMYMASEAADSSFASPIDSFGNDPEGATDFLSSQPLEAVLQPGEIIVTMDWWHQAFNLEQGLAITGNFIDKGNVLNVAERALKNDRKDMVEDILAQVEKKDMRLYRKLSRELGLS